MDEYEVRRWTGWYRYITLALLVHAFLAVARYYTDADAKGEVSVAELIPMTVPEVRRLLCRLLWRRPGNQDLAVR